MGSLLEALQAREAAARARVEALQAEMDRLAEQVAAEQELLGRLEITRQTVVEVLAGDALPGGDGLVGIGPDPNVGGGVAAPRVGTKVSVFGQDREGMRIKLKRLVERGWLVETEPGLFACAQGVAGGLDGH